LLTAYVYWDVGIICHLHAIVNVPRWWGSRPKWMFVEYDFPFDLRQFFFLNIVTAYSRRLVFVFGSRSNSISALSLHFILHSSYSYLQTLQFVSSPSPVPLWDAWRNGFFNIWSNCATYAFEIVFDIACEGVADLGKHEVGMMGLLFIIIIIILCE